MPRETIKIIQNLLNKNCLFHVCQKLHGHLQKNKCESAGPVLDRRMGLHLPMLMEEWMYWSSPSMQRTKRYGDKGQPCLIPLAELNFWAFESRFRSTRSV